MTMTRWRDYTKAKKFVRSLKFRNPEEYIEWATTSDRPYDIPSTPNREYKTEWTNWSDFLGTKLNYKQSKKAIEHLNIETCKEYFERGHELPRGVPKDPRRAFTGKRGKWLGWKDYLQKDNSEN